MYKPLFGTVSHDGGIFTMHYHKKGNESAINRQGYSKEIFDCYGFHGPIVRFDKAPLENVLESIRGEVDEIEEYYNLNNWSRPIALKQYIAKMKKNGIPVEYR